MSGRRRGGSGRGLITAVVALGCCLLSAPTAHADLDDLFDTVIGGAAAGTDQVDLADVPGDPGDFGGLDIHGVLDDPLTQLDQVLHGAPGQLGSEPAPVDSAPGAATGAAPGAERPAESGSSGGAPSLPKFSLPNAPSGGSGGSGGGGSGGGDTKPKPKVNTSASNGNPATLAAPEPAAVP
ncbi:MAG: hypothetical protein ABI253_14760 [Mycobacterium sp.]